MNPYKRKKLRRIQLVLIGARGHVGSAFRSHLAAQHRRILDDTGIDLALVAALDRRGFAFHPRALAPDSLEDSLNPRQMGDLEDLYSKITLNVAPPTVVIDCTASDEIADSYLRLLNNGVGVVTANKRANSRSLSFYRRLLEVAEDHNAPYHYETTIGAAIPVLSALRSLRQRGEKIISARGILSGSLCYILERVHQGVPFSEAVNQARELGYTEPDPLEDLQAEDLARKLLVLGRECGFATEFRALQIRPLVEFDPLHGRPLSEVLKAADATWQAAVLAADRRVERLVVLAEVDASGGRIGLHRMPLSSRLAHLIPGQNMIEIRTELQDKSPLVLCGAGAGANVTAAGVLSDVLLAAEELSMRRAVVTA